MPTLTQLEYILAVHKLKHFGRAARACHVSQPSLSAQVQKVEEELDTILFDRSKKPILTTKKGEQVVAQAKIVLSEHRKLFGLKIADGEISGEFNLGVIPTLSPYLIPIFIEKFSKTYPKVNLKINENKTEEIIELLNEDKLDGALLITPLGDEKIHEKVLFYEPFYAFVSDNHPYFKKKFIDDNKLDKESIWLLNEGHCFRDQVIKICSSSSSNVLKNVAFESGNLETIKNLVRKGSGYTLIPYLATLDLENREKENNLKRFHKPVPTREVSLIHSRSFLKKDILDALFKTIQSSLPKELKQIKTGSYDVVDL